MSVVRFGVSLEKETMDKLDSYVSDNNFPNRSQAIRNLIEKYAVEQKWQCDNLVAGAIVIVYDHHKRNIDNEINEVQHEYHHLIISSQHVHLSHETCLETIVVKGKASELTLLADKIISLKGIHHGKLIMTRT
ncbi:MAG: nickel-responsive transcriptional regulator NikR [Bacteroidales bacterium]|nr:nickel-responsive transcriptional regulator NikR [Bacteroidales bacterium]